MSDIPQGVCLKCKMPIHIVVPGQCRPLCSACEQEINEKISRSMKERGKPVENRRLIFPGENKLKEMTPHDQRR